MTVRELIAELSKLDPDLLVVISLDEEYGCNPLGPKLCVGGFERGERDFHPDDFGRKSPAEEEMEKGAGHPIFAVSETPEGLERAVALSPDVFSERE